MTSTDEHPTRRHLRPLVTEDAPFDPEYDTQPDPITQAARAAEHTLLGTLLVNPDAAPTVLPVLDPTDFSSQAHEQIWEAAADLTADGINPDLPSLARHLATNQIYLKAGGHQMLLELREHGDTVIPAQLDHLASIVRDAASLRRLDTVLAEARTARTTGDPTRIHATLEKLSDLADKAVTNFGTAPGTSAPTGLKDLTWVTTGERPTPQPPVYATRTDGHALFYTGKVNGIFGDPESGKTWLAQIAIVEALNAGGTAAMIDVDHNGDDHTAGRLILLGARPEHIADPTRFRYYEPEEADELLAAVTELRTLAPDVVLIDSLGEILPILGVKSVDNDEITTALRTVCTPLANAGSCVITIDHLPKGVDARASGYAIGGTAKKRIMRGSYLRVEVRQQPAPGQIGRAGIRIEKDTIGKLRESTPGGYAGTLTLDSTEPHITRWTISRDDSPITATGEFRPTKIMELVSRHVEQNDQCSTRDIRANVKAQAKHVQAALELLINEGFITRIDGRGNSKLHHSTAMYREAEDDRD